MAARAMVAEPSLPVANALKLFLTSAGYEVTLVHFVDDAVLQSRKAEPTVVFASASGSFDGEALCGKLKRLKPLLPVVLVYPPEDVDAAERAKAAGADAWVLGPLKKPAVLSVMQAMVRQHELLKQVDALTAELQRQKLASLAAATGSNTHDQSFFKKFLLLEVKRSRRYQYPMAFLLVGLDRLEERLLTVTAPEVTRAAIRAEAIASLGQLLRDIDLAVPFTDDRYLVFLPHTPRDGAMTVAHRIIERLGQLASFDGGSASVGVASFDPRAQPQAEVSFGSLMREATAQLKMAQSMGGGRAQVAKAADAPKRSRISLG